MFGVWESEAKIEANSGASIHDPFGEVEAYNNPSRTGQGHHHSLCDSRNQMIFNVAIEVLAVWQAELFTTRVSHPTTS